MSHWPYEEDREDGDTRDEDRVKAVQARRWLRSQADNSRDPALRLMMNDLRQLEQMGQHLFLGLDHDEDFSDCDDQGPF